MPALIEQVRYSAWFSKIVRHPMGLLARALRAADRQVRSKIKINEGRVVYLGQTLSYPRGVGMGVLSNIYWHGESGFEPFTGRVLTGLFRHSQVFIDVGSNYGFYSVLSLKVNPSMKVYAFEPNEEMFAQNLIFSKENNVNYTLDARGVGDSNASLNFFVPRKEGKKETTSASFNKEFFYNKGKETKTVTIQCTTLDDLWHTHFARANKGTAAVIKIDVEGFELNVLQGADHILRDIRPAIVCEVELIRGVHSRVLELVSSLGYDIFHIQPTGLVRLLLADFSHTFGKYRDFLFMPSERNFGQKANFLSMDDFSGAIAHAFSTS